MQIYDYRDVLSFVLNPLMSVTVLLYTGRMTVYRLTVRYLNDEIESDCLFCLVYRLSRCLRVNRLGVIRLSAIRLAI